MVVQCVHITAQTETLKRVFCNQEEQLRNLLILLEVDLPALQEVEKTQSTASSDVSDKQVEWINAWVEILFKSNCFWIWILAKIKRIEFKKWMNKKLSWAVLWHLVFKLWFFWQKSSCQERSILISAGRVSPPLWLQPCPYPTPESQMVSITLFSLGVSTCVLSRNWYKAFLYIFPVSVRNHDLQYCYCIL